MSRIYGSITELIGRTPLMEIRNLEQQEVLKARLLVKLELFNPAGSVKDRVALSMIADAKAKGLLKSGTTIIEPTSGNTGIGLASIAAAMGYQAIFTMPDTMSIERIKLLQGYGAQIVLTDGKKGMAGAIAKANELSEHMENALVLGQFDNPSNPKTHYETTGPEIWEDTEGQVDVFVAGVGTGGTITGIGSYLKKQNPNVKVVAIEPSDSPVLSGGQPGSHGLMGIGAGFFPTILDTNVYDEIIQVGNEEAYDAARKMAHVEGVLVGISSGAALYGALQLAKKEENQGKTIVVLLPDTGERYLSTPLFE